METKDKKIQVHTIDNKDIDRSVYDFKDDEKDAYKLQAGLTPEIVEKLSKEVLEIIFQLL